MKMQFFNTTMAVCTKKMPYKKDISKQERWPKKKFEICFSNIYFSETLKCNHGGSTKQVIKKNCLNVDDFLFHLI